MGKATLITETHMVLLPYAVVVCGKSHPSVLEVMFECVMDNNDGGQIRIISLVDRLVNQLEYDSMYLIEDDTGKMLDNSIVESIIHNQDHWDIKEPWW